MMFVFDSLCLHPSSVTKFGGLEIDFFFEGVIQGKLLQSKTKTSKITCNMGFIIYF